jgi:hypothetical protein
MIHEATIIGYPIQFFIKKQRFPQTNLFQDIVEIYNIYNFHGIALPNLPVDGLASSFISVAKSSSTL